MLLTNQLKFEIATNYQIGIVLLYSCAFDVLQIKMLSFETPQNIRCYKSKPESDERIPVTHVSHKAHLVYSMTCPNKDILNKRK